MPIPKEILAVERPKNTIVVVYGKNKDKYAVRERIGCKYDKGRRVPINGKIIGHIINYKFIKKQIKEGSDVKDQNTTDSIVPEADIHVKDWGNIALCDMLFQPILSELTEIYSISDALKAYCISILRVCYPGIKDYELKDQYQESFLSELYPGVALSKNTVSVFQTNLGKSYRNIVTFMKNRAASINLDDKILIDGTLKTNNSKINSLSEFSRKSKKTGNKNISILYAYSQQKGEPICCKCYPGNMLDLTAYDDFIAENHITQGVIVADKGFPSSAIEERINKFEDLHYINPLKRNSKFVKLYNLFNFKSTLDTNKQILCKKAKDSKTGKYLYSFKDLTKDSKEEISWVSKQKQDFDDEEYEKMKKKFGTIIIESDLDLTCQEIYDIYKKRWEIELVMRYYKSACELSDTRVHKDYTVIGSEYRNFLSTILTHRPEFRTAKQEIFPDPQEIQGEKFLKTPCELSDTRVHKDYTVIGSEYCNFLSTILTHRIINYFDKKELLKNYTYKELMSILCKAKKVNLSTDSKKWNLAKMTTNNEAIIKNLSLLE